MGEIKQTIRTDADRFPEFTDDIMGSVGCERIEHCFQCGTCSGTCPLSIYMDYTPRRIMHLVRSGFKREVLSSNTIWLCSSCYACTVACPKEIKITSVMYALKQRAIREGVYPKKFPIPVLADEFYHMVRENGRTNESLLAFKMFLRSRPIKLLGMWRLGLNLMTRGRFSMSQERIRNRTQLARLLDEAVKPGNGGAAR